MIVENSKQKLAYLLMVGLVSMIVSPGVQAEEAAPWWAREQFSGDWWGVREGLEKAGIVFEPYVVIDWSKNLSGGVDTRGEAFRHIFSFNVAFDFTKLLRWESGTVFVDFQNQNGQNGSDEVGDFQLANNWDQDGLTRISELWFEYEFNEGAVRIKVGKVDANNEFAYTEFGWEFVHGSASFPATNFLLPTYLDPATSVNVFFYPSDSTSLGFGIYDGAFQEGVRTGLRGPSTFFGPPADLFFIVELGYNWYLEGLPGRVAIGGWYHNGDIDRFDGGVDSGTGGFHLVIDQMLWCERPSDDEGADFYDQGVGFFFQYDLADADVASIDHHIGAGLTWRGMLPGRDDDLAGMGLSWVHFAHDPNAGFTDDSETAFEAFYKAQVTPAVTVQPYVQYIANPGGVNLDDAVNIGVRSEWWF